MEINQNQTQKTKSKLNKKILAAYWVLTILILIFIGGFVFGQLSLLKSQLPAAGGKITNIAEIPDYLTKDVDFQEFWQVWQYIKDNYVKSDVTDTQLFYGALGGVVASLKDPYSVFFDEPDAINFNFITGNFHVFWLCTAVA